MLELLSSVYSLSSQRCDVGSDQSGMLQVIMLGSLDAAMRQDQYLEGPQVHFVAADQQRADQLEQLSWKPLEVIPEQHGRCSRCAGEDMSTDTPAVLMLDHVKHGI